MNNPRIVIGGNNPFEKNEKYNVRFSYVNVFTPREDSKKYDVSVIIPKDHPQIEEIKAAIKAAYEQGKTKLGASFKCSMGDVLHDGDTKTDAEGNPDVDYQNSWYINAKSSTRPGVVKGDPATGNLKDLTENEFASGCWGAISVNFFPYDKAGRKGIGCGLNNICMRPDSRESFMGGRVSANAEFGGHAAPDADMPGDDDFDDVK